MPEPFAMRERLESDQQFLQTLYASSREDLQQAIADAALQPPCCARCRPIREGTGRPSA